MPDCYSGNISCVSLELLWCDRRPSFDITHVVHRKRFDNRGDRAVTHKILEVVHSFLYRLDMYREVCAAVWRKLIDINCSKVIGGCISSVQHMLAILGD